MEGGKEDAFTAMVGHSNGCEWSSQRGIDEKWRKMDGNLKPAHTMAQKLRAIKKLSPTRSAHPVTMTRGYRDFFKAPKLSALSEPIARSFSPVAGEQLVLLHFWYRT
jgi:hypothetical protein